MLGAESYTIAVGNCSLLNFTSAAVLEELCILSSNCMGIPSGAIKYFIGVGLSGWGIMSAYLFAQSVLEPLDYLQGLLAIQEHHDDLPKLLNQLFGIFITTPKGFIHLVLFGLTGMTVLWVIGMLRSR